MGLSAVGKAEGGPSSGLRWRRVRAVVGLIGFLMKQVAGGCSTLWTADETRSKPHPQMY